MVKSLIEHDLQVISTWKDVIIQEMNIQKDHIHLVCSIPPKVSISEFMGVLKGKMAIKLFKTYPSLRQKPYWGNHFWSCGYFVSTVGLDEDMIKRYVKYQEHHE
jgi:putative transposase